MANLRSSLYQGKVMHHRVKPTDHRFVYSVFSLKVDLDELDQLDQFRFFSINRFNLFSFQERDHGTSKGNLAAEIRQHLIDRGHSSATARIELLCYPRILGFTFNPLSVYFCYNTDDQVEVILYEVSNTFGSRHTYLIESQGRDKVIRHGCDKLMYVSPFMPMETAYQFSITPPDQHVSIGIKQVEQALSEEDRSTVFYASFKGDRISLNDRKLLKMFFQYPLMTLKVVGAIHWEALKLWRKKLTIQPRDDKVSHSISWQDKHGVTHYESL